MEFIRSRTLLFAELLENSLHFWDKEEETEKEKEGTQVVIRLSTGREFPMFTK